MVQIININRLIYRVESITLMYINLWSSHAGMKFYKMPSWNIANFPEKNYQRLFNCFLKFLQFFVKFFKSHLQRKLAFKMINCYKKEANQKQLRSNCTNTSVLFKRCMATWDDQSLDDYMLIFGQVFVICEFFNGSRPLISPEKLLKVFACSLVDVLALKISLECNRKLRPNVAKTWKHSSILYHY